MPFGTCCISLKPVVDPVVSKKGDLFSRDAIVEYLAHQKVVQRQEKSAYERQEAEKSRQAERYFPKWLREVVACTREAKEKNQSSEKEKKGGRRRRRRRRSC